MSYRIIILGKRNEELSHEECIEYIRREHKPIVRQIPGLVRSTVSIPLNPAEAGYDEIAELYFQTKEDIRTAACSDAWQQAVEDAENFINLEESIMVTVGDQTILYQSIPDDV